jgi:hypothetical protein
MFNRIYKYPGTVRRHEAAPLGYLVFRRLISGICPSLSRLTGVD